MSDEVWRQILRLIEGADIGALLARLHILPPARRRDVAGRVAELLAGEDHPWAFARRHALAVLVAGAASLRSAAQVAAWLSRRELRFTARLESSAADLAAAVADRPADWRRDLIGRLAARLPGPGQSWPQGMPGWDLVARLVVELGDEPPANDAFVAGWAWRQVTPTRHLATAPPGPGRPADDLYPLPVDARDPLLAAMVPRLFHADGVLAALTWEHDPSAGSVIVHRLAALAHAGAVPRKVLLDGCAGRFLRGGGASETAPFVTLWRELHPTPEEIPVLDLVRVLATGSSPLVRLAVTELRRVEEAGGIDPGLYVEAVQALAFRPEKKYVTAALQWIGRRGRLHPDGSLEALASTFCQADAVLRARAVRLAAVLAPHAGEAGVVAVRAAAPELPADLRETLAGHYGPFDVDELPEEPPSAVFAALSPSSSPPSSSPSSSSSSWIPLPSLPSSPSLVPLSPLPPLPPPIESPSGLAAAFESTGRPRTPAAYERLLAAFVELTHRDRTAVANALAIWQTTAFVRDSGGEIYPDRWLDEHPQTLLARCALAVVNPEGSRRLTRALGAEQPGPQPHLLVQRRFREVVHLLERGDTVPLLLATPTHPTGHLDPDVLIDRLERFAGAEPLANDFLQAMLRLPPHPDPALAERAGRLTSDAGKQLAARLYGGAPRPTVTCGTDQLEPHAWMRPQLHARVTPPGDCPPDLAYLFDLEPAAGYGHTIFDLAWWPWTMPSHREVVAAYLLKYLPSRMDSSDGQVGTLAAAMHGGGPVGAATAGALAIGMGHERAEQRAAAADAVLTLIARGELPAADLGRLIGELVGLNAVVLGRVTGVLDQVAAFAPAEAWQVLTEALTALLPQPGAKPRTGLADLLALATRCARTPASPAWSPKLTHLAARKGGSRTVLEARALAAALMPL
ncbi:DUF6493 family protein [Nonomuraea soli]|uniref:Secreted protein n=1 Tax=Nonomuraea soli TaxID=1032476 RepID=A0A7W0CPB4_9ACTN|nr:DUF6493 family protein [Nonomuraea soli]MBA2894719.1 hypothetical protein [Nonomuraea soli]